MVDYLHSTGSSGKMMIRDLGTTVEFWLNSFNSDTFNHALPWSYGVNGVLSPWLTFNYNAGAGWQKLGAWNVTTTQTVQFKLNATGTQGFGGPTTFAQLINRTNRPDPPTRPLLSNVSVSSMTVAWTDNSNGGSTILGYHVGYSVNDPSGPSTIVAAPRSPFVLSNLAMGTLYYVWVQSQNAIGWSDWSQSSFATTFLGAYVNVGGVWKTAIPYVRSGGVWKQALPIITRQAIDRGFG
jgi:hypothetical protein